MTPMALCPVCATTGSESPDPRCWRCLGVGLIPADIGERLLIDAWARRQGIDWPEGFQNAMRSPLHRRIILMVARHGSKTTVRPSTKPRIDPESAQEGEESTEARGQPGFTPKTPQIAAIASRVTKPDQSVVHLPPHLPPDPAVTRRAHHRRHAPFDQKRMASGERPEPDE